MLKVESLSKTLGSFSMREVSFSIDRGEYFVLLGASGVGKTVLLEAIAGVIRPDAGRIYLDGLDMTNLRPQNRNIGLVYQDQALFPHLSVRQNIAYGLKCHKTRRSALKAEVVRLAESVRASELLDRDVDTLSGGEAQRVALARTMATKPKCLLLDEPIASLDTRSRGDIRSLLRELNRQGQTILHVTHDYEEAVSLATRIAIMEDGRIVQDGSPESIFHSPKSEFVADFVGIKNFLRGSLGPATEGEQLREFIGPDGISIWILSDEEAGPGCLIFRSEDVTISIEQPVSSAKNAFKGIILDIIPAKIGMEVSVQIGVEISALVSRSSVSSLDLQAGKTVWANFKASAARFLCA
ncbi:MAG: ATP-binding cassette domain-containing protein [Candidatus Coatesbacteria bacterium]|nr:ATP-binding cassette domain-containing protein [Candidatus Coatesbacteria bacterium]